LLLLMMALVAGVAGTGSAATGAQGRGDAVYRKLCRAIQRQHVRTEPSGGSRGPAASRSGATRAADCRPSSMGVAARSRAPSSRLERPGSRFRPARRSRPPEPTHDGCSPSATTSTPPAASGRGPGGVRRGLHGANGVLARCSNPVEPGRPSRSGARTSPALLAEDRASQRLLRFGRQGAQVSP
jgi:hypothetical protein